MQAITVLSLLTFEFMYFTGCLMNRFTSTNHFYASLSLSKVASLTSIALTASLLTACGSGGGSESVDLSTFPVITLNGEANTALSIGDTYVEQGATVADDVDVDITVDITGEVDNEVASDYIITYSATDSDGHTSTIERTVSVSDLTEPVITLALTKGEQETVELGLGRDYNELGASATDNVDTDVAVVIDSSNLDVNTIGTYSVTYSATDEAGNVGKVSRAVNVVAARPFITTWKTDNPGLSADDQITISTNPDYAGEYNYTVDWGDDSTSIETGDATHTYSEPGTYTVSINGDFPHIYFATIASSDDGNDDEKLLTIEQWGDIKLLSLRNSFYATTNLTSDATDTPDLRLVEELTRAFHGAINFNADISDWDVSNVESFYKVFAYATNFNSDISQWDISSATSIRHAFIEAETFNQDISGWDTSNVTDMEHIFDGALSFDQDLSGWDVSSVKFYNDFFNNVTFSVDNFNALLNSWAPQMINRFQLNREIDFGCNEASSDESKAALADLLEDQWDVFYTCDAL